MFGSDEIAEGRATLRDVAVAAGVSTATASQALSGKGRMSVTTRARIHSIALRLDYRPHHQAAALRRRTTGTIGFVMVPNPSITSLRQWSDRNAEYLYSLVSHAARRGLGVTVIPEHAPDLVQSSRIDALCFFDIGQDEPALLEALRLGIPVLTNDTDDPRFRVVVDSGAANFTSQALDYLRDRGARRPGLLTSGSSSAAITSAEAAHRRWCDAAGSEAVAARADDDSTLLARAADLLDKGCDALLSLAGHGPALLRMIGDRGQSCPDDIQLIGLVSLTSMPRDAAGITSILCHPELLAPSALDAFVASGPDSGSGVTSRVALPWELLVAGTTRD